MSCKLGDCGITGSAGFRRRLGEVNLLVSDLLEAGSCQEAVPGGHLGKLRAPVQRYAATPRTMPTKAPQRNVRKAGGNDPMVKDVAAEESSTSKSNTTSGFVGSLAARPAL
mmetsp:Transcript_14500/g.43256  ORF Transcript_14500/g.43256 Transcript_14500/m.43256 type:complete len:111 (+) Transcript_14500:218-550(+)